MNYKNEVYRIARQASIDCNNPEYDEMFDAEMEQNALDAYYDDKYERLKMGD